MAESQTQPPRGTRDFYPEDQRLRSWLFDHFRSSARAFGFEEVDAPVLEHAELFIRKAGEEIVDQLYHFELHDRHLALRPELTPSLARMVMARQGSLALPLRWFSIPQCWRYERMTRGRRREHFQWNMDIWGEPEVTAEAELIAAAFDLCDRIRVPRDAILLRLNHRALLEESLLAGALSDRPDAFEPLCIVIDKLEKIGAEAVVEQLTAPDGAVALSREAALEVVDRLSVRSLDEALARAPEGSRAAAELERLFGLLSDYGLDDRVVFDASVVRGLAYYTGVVFEAFDTRGELRAVFGGGRYDRLIESLGGKPCPAVGFGFGDAVVVELLGDLGQLPELPRALDAVVVALGDAGSEPEQRAIAWAARLRAEGRSVELLLAARPKRAFKHADRVGAREVHVLGADEIAKGRVKVRDLASGEERELPIEG